MAVLVIGSKLCMLSFSVCMFNTGLIVHALICISDFGRVCLQISYVQSVIVSLICGCNLYFSK